MPILLNKKIEVKHLPKNNSFEIIKMLNNAGVMLSHLLSDAVCVGQLKLVQYFLDIYKETYINQSTVDISIPSDCRYDIYIIINWYLTNISSPMLERYDITWWKYMIVIYKETITYASTMVSILDEQQHIYVKPLTIIIGEYIDIDVISILVNICLLMDYEQKIKYILDGINNYHKMYRKIRGIINQINKVITIPNDM